MKSDVQMESLRNCTMNSFWVSLRQAVLAIEEMEKHGFRSNEEKKRLLSFKGTLEAMDKTRFRSND